MNGIDPNRQGRLGVLLASILCVFPSAAGAAIRGTVVDENGAPLAAAVIRAFAQETPRERAARILAKKTDRDPLSTAQSGDDGSFRIEATPPVVELAVSADSRASFFTDALDSDDLGAILLPKAKPLTGRVTAGGKPVAGAIVIAGQSVVRTANDGTFQVVRPASDSMTRAVVVHPEYAPTEPIYVMADRRVDLELTKGVSIRGRVMSGDGRAPVAHAAVSAGLYAVAETSEDGSFVIAHASSSWRNVRVIAPGGAAISSRSGAASYDMRLRPVASVNGVVRDAKTRSAVAGMRVTLMSQSEGPSDYAITDAKGNFAFSSVPPGRYNVLSAHPSMQLESGGAMLTVSAGEKQWNAYAAAPLIRVAGSVIDEERKAVGAAVVTATAGQSDIPRIAVTNAKGEFSVHVVGPSTPLIVRRDGYIAATASAADGVSRALVVTLRRGFPLTVSLVDKDQKPIPQAIVSFSPTDRRADLPRTILSCDGGPCSTSEAGRFEIRMIPGTFTVGISGASVVPKTYPSMKIDEKSSPLTLVADRGVTVSGRVVYSDGSPVADKRVILKAAPSVVLSAQTDPSGSFKITSAPRGPVTVAVQAFDGGDTPGEIGGRQVDAPADDVVLTVPPGGRISGVVVDSSTRQPIPDFQVWPRVPGWRPTTFNSADGSFSFEHLAAGQIDLTASAAGYVRCSLNGVEVVEGKTTANLELRLEPGARVTGHATSREGEALSGVYVTAMDGGSRASGVTDSATTDSNGEYKLDSVPPGSQRIMFSKPGWVRQDKSVETGAGKESRLDVVLDHGLELRGRVVDESGQAVTQADVRLQAPGDGAVGRSDAAGAFTISGLRDIHYSVVARKSGYVDGRIDDVLPAASGPVTLTLRHGGTVTGHVSGIPAGASYVSVSVSGDRVWTNGNADLATGTFSINGVPDGNFFAEATAAVPGRGTRRSSRVGLSVTNGSAAPVEIAFAEGLTIQGRVTMQGKPAVGASVSFTARSATGQNANATVSTDGSYVVNGVTAGDYRVSVSAAAGGAIYNEPYTVTASTVYDIDVHTSSLNGRVADAETSSPLSNAQILLANLDRTGVFQRPVTTDIDGTYAIDPIAEGRWRVTVQRDGYKSEIREVTIAGASTLDVQLSAAVKTTLHLVDATDGRPVSGWVTATDSSKKRVFSASARIDGTADLWLAPGNYVVRAGAQQYIADPITISVPGSDSNVPMQRAGRVVVRWTRPGVSMVELRAVSSVAPGAAGPATASMRSQNGAFDNLRPGQWLAQLLGPDAKPIDERPVSVVGGQTATVVFP